MYRLVTVLTLISTFAVSNHALALPGMAPDGSGIGQYDPLTGQIIISLNGVSNWWVEDVGSRVMTGDEPLGLPAFGGHVSNNDTRIGESNFVTYSVTNLNLGNVAQTGLVDDGSLDIFWNAGLGQPIEHQPLEFATGTTNSPPTATINGPFVVDLLNDPLNLTLDASGSTDDGNISPLTYRWDLDNDNIFEINTGTMSTLEIADVTSAFGGHGFYPVGVEASDGEFWDIATTSVQLLSGPFIPASAQYDPATGQIVVSVFGVNNWYIRSSSFGLTGDTPAALPAGGGVVSDYDDLIGETSFPLFSYTANLGNVAQTGLPEGDLKIYWNQGVGAPLQSLPLIYGTIVPEPTGLVLFGMGLLGLACCRGRCGRC